MRIIVTILFLILSAKAMSCECGEYTRDPRAVEERLLKKVFGKGMVADLDAQVWLRAYPTPEDRRALAEGMQGTDCHGKGPQGEDLFQCSSKNISVYRVAVTTVTGRPCTADLRVESSFKNVNVRLLARQCRAH
jgi:hypothetical protein